MSAREAGGGGRWRVVFVVCVGAGARGLGFETPLSDETRVIRLDPPFKCVVRNQRGAQERRCHPLEGGCSW